MANTFLTPSIIARQALMILENNLVFAGLVHREHAREWSGAKVGDTISIRRPATFTAQEFTSTVSVQNASEQSVSLKLEKHFDVTFAVTAKDWTLNLQDFTAQLIQPAVVAIAQGIDSYVAGSYKGASNFVGTAGDPPDTVLDIGDIDKKLNEMKVPLAGRNVVLDPTGKRDLYNITSFFQADQRGDQGTALREASMGRYMGFDWFMDQNIKAHTAGTLSNGSTHTAKFNGAGNPQTVGATTMNIDETTLTGTVVTGDVFTVAGDTTQYTVTSGPHTASSNAITGISFDPPAAVAWADDAVITFRDTHVANLAFHRNGIALALVTPELPEGASKAMVMSDRGLGIRYVAGYDMSTKTDTISLDVLAAAKVIDRNLVARVLG